MQNRITKVFVASTVRDGESGVTNLATLKSAGNAGDLIMLDAGFNHVTIDGLLAPAAVVPSYIAMKNADGTVIVSEPINTNFVDRKYTAGAANVNQLSVCTMFAPTIGKQYFLRLEYLHTKDTVGDKIPDFRLFSVTATNNTAASLATQFANRINNTKHVRNYVTAATSTDDLEVSGINEFVYFKISVYDADGNSMATIATTTNLVAPGNPRVLSELEEVSLGMYGLDNRRSYPNDYFLNRINLGTNPSLIYDVVTLSYNTMEIAADVAKTYNTNLHTIVIAAPRATSAYPATAGTANEKLRELAWAYGIA